MANQREESTEATPLRSNGAPEKRLAVVIKALTCAVTMIVLSVCLIFFNSHLMNNGFPYAMVLVSVHMVFCTSMAALVYVVKPSWMPSLSDPLNAVCIDRELILKGALPVGLVFSSGLVFGNMAYGYLSVSFLQMIKECNIVVCYMIALAMRNERFSWQAVKIICIAVVGMMLSVHGELNFTWAGFIMQTIALLSEGVRINLQTLLLSGKGKLDPLTYVLIISPMCFLWLSGAMTVLHLFPLEHLLPKELVIGMTVPSMGVMIEHGHMLLISCMLAFGLNLSIAFLIATVSGMGYIFCQVTKDICAVLVGVFVMQEIVSGLQKFAFALQICAVYCWSMLKNFPEEMNEHGLVSGMINIHLTRIQAAAKETSLQAPPQANPQAESEKP